MADIKDLGIFGGNKGLDAIKAAENKNQIKNPSLELEKKRSSRKNSKGAGAPIRNFDRSYSATQPIKLSALLNGTLRVLTEKYMTNETKDEILRKALNDYVKHNLTKEDKLDLLNDLEKDLKLFREKYPTVEEIDSEGNIIKTVREIESETTRNLKSSWGLQ